MAVDGAGVRPLSDRERRELDGVERGLFADTGLRAALRHGVVLPRRQLPARVCWQCACSPAA